jgi:hypothetical protein
MTRVLQAQEAHDGRYVIGKSEGADQLAAENDADTGEN